MWAMIVLKPQTDSKPSSPAPFYAPSLIQDVTHLIRIVIIILYIKL